MTDTVVVEGQVKFRDGKKWKSRWVALRKPSPVADCLSLQVYRDKSDKVRGRRERLQMTLEGICGVEPGLGYDGVAYTLTILCLGHTVGLGFDSREGLTAWDARLRYSLGEVHRFSVGVQPGTKLESGPASLHLCNNLLVLTRDLPPAVIGQWKLSDLRRYGDVPNGFVFEGGTRCGYWAGVFFLSCSEGEQISFLFDCIVRGISPSRTPSGLRPNLPDPSASRSSSEERINHETSDLERRLSMLSHSSRQSSTASTSSYSTSVAGDDRSSISSSSSSQSDASYGSHFPLWPEPKRPTSSTETLSAPPTARSSTNLDEDLYNAVMNRTPFKPPSHLRSLHDSGRQSSLDSGIGVATASSQSSYSGSFSSCTGSLDTASQGGGEEFGSVLSLPPPLLSLPPLSLPPPPPSLPPLPPPILPPPPPPLSLRTPEPGPLSPPTPCSCLPSCSSSSRTSGCSSGAPRWQHEEYQAPSLLRLQYDSPRNLLHTLAFKDPPPQGGASELGRDRQLGGDGDQGQIQGHECPSLPSTPTVASLQWVETPRQAPVERLLSWSSERAPPVDSGDRCSIMYARLTPRPLLLPGCPVCGGTQSHHPCVDHNYITHEQWFSARKRHVTQTNSPSHSGLSPTPDPPPQCREVVRGEAGLSHPLEPSYSPPPPPGTMTPSRQTSVSGGRFFKFPPDASAMMMSSVLDRRHHTDPSVNYVNIPVSPAAKANRAGRELLYMELDLQPEPYGGPVSTNTTAARGNPVQLRRPIGGSTTYAHIDITASETAQRVAAEHAQGREDRLMELEENTPRGERTG
ncbi:protein Dok-7 isoform X1 [Oncorhynchus mykiss]|uniref:protein Dok-7 isoform X1 n=1 Tax=Oncorhynchus mykiss TaxID=8022 RepID=UPI0018784366|nr:protein Dok-7 isoform X1 [Oncorhynchus mykiss]